MSRQYSSAEDNQDKNPFGDIGIESINHNLDNNEISDVDVKRATRKLLSLKRRLSTVNNKTKRFIRSGANFVLNKAIPKEWINKDKKEDQVAASYRKWVESKPTIKLTATISVVLVVLIVYGIPLLKRYTKDPHIFRNKVGTIMENVHMIPDTVIPMSIPETKDSMKYCLGKPQTAMIEEEIQADYTESCVFATGVPMNISISNTIEILKSRCMVGECLCISAAQIGLLKNLIVLNSKNLNSTIELLEPHIVHSSTESFSVKFESENTLIEERAPKNINVRYLDLKNNRLRVFLKDLDSACVYKSISLNKGM